VTAAETPGAGVPASDIDPFCAEFFEDPFPAHQELRDLGPLVRLRRYPVWAAAMRELRVRFAAAADALIDELVRRGTIDAVSDLAEAYPLTVFPDAMGMPRDNRHFLLPYGNLVFNAFGPRNAFFAAAVAESEPVLAWLQRQMQRDAFAPGGFGAAIHTAADSGELTAEEAPIVARSLLSAGVDTTVSGSARRSIALPGSRTSSRGCAPTRRSPAPPSRRRCATRPRCRPSSAPRAGRSRLAACPWARARRY
jgi:hypothetical protein